MSKTQKYSINGTRLGGTSFIIPADYVDGVRYTAERCDDVALLITCVGENNEWLIKPQEVLEIKNIIEGEGTSLHIHLPTDTFCDLDGIKKHEEHLLRALERVDILSPHTFVLHVDIVSLQNKNSLASPTEQEAILNLLDKISKNIPDPKMLAIENLETFPLPFWDFCTENHPQGAIFSRCMDIGHIWKDGKNPVSVLPSWIDHIKLIHLHGIKPRYIGNINQQNYHAIPPSLASCRHLFGKRPRDHKSLIAIPDAWLDNVLHFLWKHHYDGVINLEVFDPIEFEISYQCILKSRERFENTHL